MNFICILSQLKTNDKKCYKALDNIVINSYSSSIEIEPQFECIETSLVAQMVKRLPTMQENGSISGLEDRLEKEMATHSSTLAWKIPWTEEPGRL